MDGLLRSISQIVPECLDCSLCLIKLLIELASPLLILRPLIFLLLLSFLTSLVPFLDLLPLQFERLFLPVRVGVEGRSWCGIFNL